VSFSLTRYVENNYTIADSVIYIVHYYIFILLTCDLPCMLKVESKYDIVFEGRPNATENSTMLSQHLKIVELKCFEVDQWVINVLKFLGTLHICKITTKTGSLLHLWFTCMW
jgi:hypothetical protein